jgi:hypothetical protein
VALSGAYGAFDEDGGLTDESSAKRVKSLVEQLIEVTGRLKNK